MWMVIYFNIAEKEQVNGEFVSYKNIENLLSCGRRNYLRNFM